MDGADVVVFVGFKPASGIFCSLAAAEESAEREQLRAGELSREALAMIEGRAATVVSTVKCIRAKMRSLGEELVELAESFGADCILMGTRGYGELKSKAYGSVTQSVLFQNSSVPAMIVHAGAVATRQKHGHSVLFAIDGSERSLQAVEHGAKFVTEGCTVYMFHALVAPQRFVLGASANTLIPVANLNYEEEFQECDKHSRQIATLAYERLNASSRVKVPLEEFHFVAYDSDNPSHAITKWQQKPTSAVVDLMVVGSRGETGMSRLWNGSLAHDLLHDSGAFALLVAHEPNHGVVEQEACPSCC
eukprot:TRINITY_DN61006_c0_g1_i2.p1 TRINITY_DN61006_c0_g1~~TRINITY_DN61006_c0_g1_i2.p1  ORF type:complete len:305 (-),score=53.50 TRINITY_DN61006_c0_g1_i2:58-972(-)